MPRRRLNAYGTSLAPSERKLLPEPAHKPAALLSQPAEQDREHRLKHSPAPLPTLLPRSRRHLTRSPPLYHCRPWQRPCQQLRHRPPGRLISQPPATHRCRPRQQLRRQLRPRPSPQDSCGPRPPPRLPGQAGRAERRQPLVMLLQGQPRRGPTAPPHLRRPARSRAPGARRSLRADHKPNNRRARVAQHKSKAYHKPNS